MYKTTGIHQKIFLLEEFQWVSVLLQNIIFHWNNSKNFYIWGWNLICSLEYIVKGILQWKIFNTLHLQTPWVKFKRISECILRKLSSARKCIINSKAYKLWNFSQWTCRPNFCGKITRWRRPYICKWTML